MLWVSDMQTILVGGWPFGGAGERGARREYRYWARKSAGLRLKSWNGVRRVHQGEEVEVGADMVGMVKLMLNAEVRFKVPRQRSQLRLCMDSRP